MPFVHIRIAGRDIRPEQIRRLQEGATQLMATLMRKNAELTAVLVEEAEAGAWSIAGRAVTDAAHLDVKVTRGTNTAEEKAQFIAAANALLREVLAVDLPVATYVVIDEVPADAWGYDGRTQHGRHAASLQPAGLGPA